MVQIIADTHTHTLATDHAYSTLAENVAAAKARGLFAIAMTEHSPSMPGAPSWLHFSGLRMIPRVIDGVTILKGAEVNIMDYDGALDLSDHILKDLEWVIASMHSPNLDSATVKEHTRGWLEVAKNPLVHVIGHSGDPRYAFDHEPVLGAFREYGKIVEINAHSFKARPGSREICAEIAKGCARLKIPVVVSSDAHHASKIGVVEPALQMLSEIGFPEDLILNADKDRFFEAARERAGLREAL